MILPGVCCNSQETDMGTVSTNLSFALWYLHLGILNRSACLNTERAMSQPGSIPPTLQQLEGKAGHLVQVNAAVRLLVLIIKDLCSVYLLSHDFCSLPPGRTMQQGVPLFRKTSDFLLRGCSSAILHLA